MARGVKPLMSSRLRGEGVDFPYKKGIVTLNEPVMNYLPKCTYVNSGNFGLTGRGKGV